MESMSWFLRLTELHLNQTFDRAYVLAEKGLSVRGINLPAFHGPTVFFTLSWSWSPLTFLVCWNVSLSSTPTKSRWSESCTYWCGRSSWERVPFHLPRGRNLTLPAEGSQFNSPSSSLHPPSSYSTNFLTLYQIGLRPLH